MKIERRTAIKRHKQRTSTGHRPEVGGALVLVALLIVAVAGCVGPPEQQLEAVGGLLESARRAGAADAATEAFIAAEGLLESARREIDEQQARRFFVRRFQVANRLLDDAERQARAALATVEAAAEGARDRAEVAIESANQTVAKVRDTWREIPRGADTADDRAGLEEDIAALDTQIARATEHFASGAFDRAAEDAEAVHSRGQALADAATRSLMHDVLAEP